MQSEGDYFNEVLNHDDFVRERELWREELGNAKDLVNSCQELQVKIDQFRYTYQWDWMGVPIIKVPDDIMVIQEFYFRFKPTAVVEIGVARGGGMALASSLQSLLSIAPNVLGIDLKIFQHTHDQLRNFGNSGMSFLECDSTSLEAQEAISTHIKDHNQIFVTLDSDHSHDHVLKELKLMNSVLPVGSVVLVADTILEEFVSSNTARNWGPGNSPASALRDFLSTNQNWSHLKDWSSRALFSESRGGWIVKKS